MYIIFTYFPDDVRHPVKTFLSSEVQSKSQQQLTSQEFPVKSHGQGDMSTIKKQYKSNFTKIKYIFHNVQGHGVLYNN